MPSTTAVDTEPPAASYTVRPPPEATEPVSRAMLSRSGRAALGIGNGKPGGVGSTAQPMTFTFAAFSDNHFKPDGMSWPDGRLFRRCREAHECLVRDINAASPDFIINKGDLTDVYDQYRLRTYREAVAGLKPPVHK